MRPAKGSPVVDAGVAIPAEWPATTGVSDRGRPDIGAIPEGGLAWRLGVRGRLDASGRPAADAPLAAAQWVYAPQPQFDYAARPRALIVEGYPAFDAPIFAYLLRKAGYQVETSERAWFDVAKLSQYKLVIYDGSLARAKVEKTAFDAADIPHVRSLLETGGTLIVTRERADLFAVPEGRKLLDDLVGSASATIRDAQPQVRIRQPDHSWLKSLAGQTDLPWLSKGGLLRTTKGESLIGSDKGSSLLHRATLGRGQFIYLGWSPAASIPGGREKTAAAEEPILEAQVAVLREILASAK